MSAILNTFSAPFSAAQAETPPDALLDELARLVEQRTMMQFGVERRTHLINIVSARARSRGEAAATYLRRVCAPGGERELWELVDDLTINETTFFRNVPQLEMFARVALSETVARKKSAGAEKQVKIWSAACSTGQEVYTLAALAFEALRFLPAWSAHVLGTDISPSVIETAREGVYPKARLDTMPQEILSRYFDDLGERIRVKETLRRIVSFQQHNLREPSPPGVFDVIFCRNVMIYFSREEQARLASKFYERLAPQGFLFIGHSESLQGLGVNFKLRIHERGVAYQRD